MKEILKAKHCCKMMRFILNEKRAYLYYDEVFRWYGLKLYKSRARQGIFYCPWCGKKLPTSLNDIWFDTLENEYNLEDPYDNKRKIPKEFKSDEWWKKRGL